MIFKIFRAIIKFCVNQFFGKIHIQGTPLSSGPVIYASNHPNQAIDPFLIGALLPRNPYFLAKSTLFRGKIRSYFLRMLHMIPVYRKQDASDTAQNLETFKSACTILEAHESIVIFPEGTSSERRILLPLKTGAARIALQAESTNNFKLGVQIQPVSIVYGNPRVFQSSVTITFHDLISVESFSGVYSEDPKKAAQLLTDSLESQMKMHIPHVHDQLYQELAEKVALLFEGTLINDKELFERIASAVTLIQDRNPNAISPIVARINQFFESIEKVRIPREAIRFERSNLFETSIRLIISIIGVITFYLPYQLTRVLTNKFVLDQHNAASAKIGFGILSFGLYGVILSFVCAFMTNWNYGFISFAFLMILGTITNRNMHILFWIRAKFFASRAFELLRAELYSLRAELLKIESEMKG